MKKLISILMAFSVIFTNVSQNKMFVIHADEVNETRKSSTPTPTTEPTFTPIPTPTPTSEPTEMPPAPEQETCPPPCICECNLNNIGVLTLLRELIFRVVGGTIVAIGKAFVYSMKCGQRLLGVADQVIFGPDETTKKAEG